MSPMCLGKRSAALEDNCLTVFGFAQPLEDPRDPVVILDIDRGNTAIRCRRLNQFKEDVLRFVQVHRMFQALASGQSPGSIPRLKRVVGLIESLSVGRTSCPLRVSSMPSNALVHAL